MGVVGEGAHTCDTDWSSSSSMAPAPPATGRTLMGFTWARDLRRLARADIHLLHAWDPTHSCRKGLSGGWGWGGGRESEHNGGGGNGERGVVGCAAQCKARAHPRTCTHSELPLPSSTHRDQTTHDTAPDDRKSRGAEGVVGHGDVAPEAPPRHGGQGAVHDGGGGVRAPWVWQQHGSVGAVAQLEHGFCKQARVQGVHGVVGGVGEVAHTGKTA